MYKNNNMLQMKSVHNVKDELLDRISQNVIIVSNMTALIFYSVRCYTLADNIREEKCCKLLVLFS